MSSLIVRGKARIDDMEFTHIEGGFGPEKRAMLAKDIAEIHKRELKDVNRRINDNRNRFKDGIDVIDLKNGEFEAPLQELGFSNRDVSISNNIYVLSERGYSKLLKVLEDDFAWEQYEKLVDKYFSMREQLHKPTCIEDVLIQSLQEMKDMRLQISETKREVIEARQEVASTKEEIQGIRDVISINPKADWRKETNKMLNAIGKKMSDYKTPFVEAYDALKERGNCRPSVLISNLKERALMNGMAPSKADSLTILDVLENEPRLREIYVSIVKEMAIKHGV